VSVSVSVSSPFRIGLNPYGLTYTLGLQGSDTTRANPNPLGLPGFIQIAKNIGAHTLELDLRWLTPLDDVTLGGIANDAAQFGMTIVCSTWLRHEPDETLDDARRIARVLGGALIRMHLAPVLEGARASYGDQWPAMVAHAGSVLRAEAAKARDEGLRIGIENHQDFGSEELLAFAHAAGDNVGIVLDTGNPFAVGEDPVAFTERVAHRLVHIHLKDYRARFTDEGYRLVRCAIGDGCVPLTLIADTIARLAPGLPITASLEPAALDSRHIRLFTAGWWQHYPPRAANELAVALGRLRHRRIEDLAHWQTPWEHQAPSSELIEYEATQLARSVDYVRGMGWM
jgi:sugar phosphate isomerase/epimerase